MNNKLINMTPKEGGRVVILKICMLLDVKHLMEMTKKSRNIHQTSECMCSLSGVSFLKLTIQPMSNLDVNNSTKTHIYTSAATTDYSQPISAAYLLCFLSSESQPPRVFSLGKQNLVVTNHLSNVTIRRTEDTRGH